MKKHPFYNTLLILFILNNFIGIALHPEEYILSQVFLIGIPGTLFLLINIYRLCISKPEIGYVADILSISYNAILYLLLFNSYNYINQLNVFPLMNVIITILLIILKTNENRIRNLIKISDQKINRTLVVILFSISMAMLESAVVVYLRELYYPGGFEFPLKSMSDKIVLTELFREAATIIMLVSIGIFNGKTNASKFAWFIISFGIWDIFYYVFLYLLLGWPSGLFEMDILFLIPIPWFGPVIAPVLVSICLIAFGTIILEDEAKGFPMYPDLLEKAYLIIGCFTVLLSFTVDYIYFCINNGLDFMNNSMRYVPNDRYIMLFFLPGIALIILAIFRYHIRIQRSVVNRIFTHY